MEVARSNSEQQFVLKALVQTAVSVLLIAKRIFREKQIGELRTPSDVYKRQLVVTVGKIIAVVIAASGAYVSYELSLPRITVLEATFGANCDGAPSLPGAPNHSVVRGNVTQRAAAACDNFRGRCDLPITASRFGDPVPLCAKEFNVTWLCSGDPVAHGATVAAEATGKSLALTCGKVPRIMRRRMAQPAREGRAQTAALILLAR